MTPKKSPPKKTPQAVSSRADNGKSSLRSEAEARLLESERRFRQTLENVNLIAIELDISGNITFCNNYFLQLTGWQRDEITGRNWFRTCLPDRLRKQIEQVFSTSLPSGAIPVHFENEILTRQGEDRLIRWNNTILHDPAGNPIGVSCIGEDITENRRAEQHIKNSERELTKAQSYAHVGSWIWNINTGNLEWSDEMYAIFGISKENFGGNLQEVVANSIHPDDRQKVEESNLSVANEGKPIPLEYRILRPDGSERVVWAEAGEMELDADGKPALLRGIVMDITERKRAEEELQASERRYRERVIELETIMDIAPVALWIAQDSSCHSIKSNRTANELHRIQPYQNPSLTPAADQQQLQPRQMRIFHDGAEITAQELPLQVCASKGIEIRDFESQIVFDDGTVIYELGNAKPLFDENGQSRGAVGAFTDITGLKQAEEEIQRRAEELDGLQKTVLDITASQNLPGLLESIVERACQLLGATGGGLYLNDPAKKEVRCVVSYNTSSKYVGVVIKHGEGVSGKVAQSGQPLNISDYQDWPGRSDIFKEEKPFSSVLGVPLLWSGQVSGVIDLFFYEADKSFDQADQDLLTLFAGHAAIAIENSRLLTASLAGEAEVRTLSTRLAEAEENERRRIARELHDQVGQSLSALSINMNIMSSQIPEYLPGFKRRLDDSLMLIDQTTDHIRNLMSELRPAVLDDYGLKAALDWAAGSVANRTTLKLLVEGECNRFPPRVEISIFRIAQEALGNITRHARARNVKILLTQDGPEMSMSVTDDGVGFDPSAVAATEKSGWGLRLMSERAESIGASLQVESTPGQGTTITVKYHDQDSTGG